MFKISFELREWREGSVEKRRKKMKRGMWLSCPAGVEKLFCVKTQRERERERNTSVFY